MSITKWGKRIMGFCSPRFALTGVRADPEISTTPNCAKLAEMESATRFADFNFDC